MFEGLNGRALRRDLETMFQLIYLTFTQPRADPEAFRAATDQLNAALANRQALPEAAFEDALTAAVSQNHLRARPLTAESIPQMNLEKSMAFYRDRFADASDFTFVFVGSFDLPTMKPLVERYLGSLPALKRKEAGRDVGIRPPAGVVDRTVTKGSTPKSQVGVVFTGPFQSNAKSRLIIRTMAETLAGNLQRVLREDLGGTYGVSVVPSFAKRPLEEYRVSITFACDPARTRGSRQGALCRRRRLQDRRAERRPDGGRASGGAARPRDRQPAEQLDSESADVRLSVRRTGSRRVHVAWPLRTVERAGRP